MAKLRITYFPMEEKFSVWDEKHNLIKEWFNSREQAQAWIDNVYNKPKRFMFVVWKDDKIIGEVTSHAPSLEEAQIEVNDLFVGYGIEFDFILLDKIEEVQMDV